MTIEEAETRTRSLLWLAGLLCLALVGVLVNAALNNGDSVDGNPIRAAAARTEREPGGHAATEILYSIPGGPPIASTGRGVFDLRSGRSRASFVAARGEFGRQTIHAYADRDAGYASSPEYVHLLPPSMHWLKVDTWLGVNAKMSLPGRWNPADQVRMLRAAGEVEDLGEQEVLGVMTKRYGGRVDLRDYAATLARQGDGGGAAEFRSLAALVPAPVLVEAWVDPGGRFKRLRTVTTLPPGGAGEAAVTVEVRTDLTAFGTVALPPAPRAGDTLDVSPLLRWQAHLRHGRSVTLVSGPALSAAAFHRQASAICDRFGAASNRLTERSRPAEAGLRRLGEGKASGRAGEERFLGAVRSYMTVFLAPAIKVVHRFVDRMGALAPPAASSTEFERLVRIEARQEALLAAEIRAGQIGALGIGRKVARETSPLEREGNSIARHLGLESCVSTVGHNGTEDEPLREERPSFH